MEFQLPIHIPPLSAQIGYADNILLSGSCFTEQIGNRLADLKFQVMQNPNGILFDPASVTSSLLSYIDDRRYSRQDLFFSNELWQSWDHHSRFSHLDAEACLSSINTSQEQAHHFLKKASWLILTLGSSFSYRLTENDRAVANCHRAPSQQFRKHLMSAGETSTALNDCLRRLLEFNSNIKIIFTISPVRHIRDGVVANNRSKAALIEAVHQTVENFEQAYYFPAYELVVDVLRDYRFYDIDMVHPNYSATGYVMEKFTDACIDPAWRELMENIRRIVTARKHRALQPGTNAHREFLRTHLEKTIALQEKYPFLDLTKELTAFK